MTRFSLAALVCLLFATLAAGAPPPSQKSAGVDFGGRDAVIELRDSLGPYKMPASAKPKASSWYSLYVSNSSARPATRILQAGQSSVIALDILPHATRPAIVSLASPDPGAIVESAKAYGGRAYRVSVPPGGIIGLAVEVANAETPPSLLAWTEPALAAHNRRLAIFIAAVAGLIFAAAAITGGLAVMTGHKPPMWAAMTLTLVLLTRLAGTGMFDASLATHVGGPFGLTALFAGLSLAAGARLGDTIVPLREIWPSRARHFHWGVVAVSVLAVLAYLGVPGTTLLTDGLVVIGSAAITAYLVHRGRHGSQPARVLAPSAAVFALVALAATMTTVGGFGSTTVAPDVAGGFAAAGAVLLALAVAAGEGIAMLPVPHRIASAKEPPTVALAAIGASHQGIFDLEFDTDEVLLSRDAASLLGLSEARGRMSHAAWIERVHADDRAVYEQALTDYRSQVGLAFRIEFRARDESGRYPWFELRATMMGGGARAGRCLGLIADITVRKETETAVVAHALRDTLTGLGNRAALLERLAGLGDGFLDTTLAVLDIDRFKAIHGSLGDAGADALLVQAAQRMVKWFGQDVFRVGGDAFAVIGRDGIGATALGNELVKLCGAPYMQDSRRIFAPASVGVTVGHDARDAVDLVGNAEQALLQAKQAGGGCASVYVRGAVSAEMPRDSVALEAELRAAIEHDQFVIFYQPIVRLADGAVAGFEALLRWRHPEKGLVAPSDFIAHSEATGLIVALGRFALERAAHDLAQWQRFFPLSPPLFVSVNVSQRQLRDAGFENFLRLLLETSAVAPGSLRLEITESAAVGNAQAALRRIRALGVGMAIDDFGTGQSSLSRLKELPFDTVKVDQSFLARHGGTHSESESAVVLGSIVTLAHDLKREVVVEGVESEEDVRALKALGCEYAQGFHFSPPLALGDALNYIARHYNPVTAVKPDRRPTTGP